MEETTTSQWGPLATPIHTDPEGVRDDGPPYRENAFVSWWDPESRSYGIAHFSTTPNGAGSRARLSIGSGNRQVEIVEPLEWGTMDSESITVDLENEIRAKTDGLEFEIHQEPFVPQIDFTTTKAVPGLDEENYTLNHYQQPVRANGKAVIDGDELPFDGFGWRDRTWGFRDESKTWIDYTCLCIVIGDETIVLYKIIDGEGRLRPSAWKIDQDGQHDCGEFSFVRNASGLLGEATVELPEGPSLTVKTSDVLGGFWNPLGSDHQTGPACSVYDEFVVLESSDGRPASALCEHGIVRNIN